MSVFQKAAQTVKGLFETSGSSVLGVDISSSAIKVVQLRQQAGQAVLETYGEIALGPYAGKAIGQAVSLPPKQMAEALSDLLRESKTSTRDAGIAIPFGSSLLSTISVPNIDKKELDQIVPIEARKYIPVPISEVLFDWQPLPTLKAPSDDEKEPEKISVMFVAIHKEVIQTFQQIISEARVDAAFFEIELFGTVRSVVDQGIQPMLVIDFGAQSTKVYIVERGVVLATHNINRGGQDITSAIASSRNIPFEKAEEMKRQAGLLSNIEGVSVRDHTLPIVSYIFSEIRRVMLGYEKKYGKPITKAVFSGGGALLKGLLDESTNDFSLEISLADPFNRIQAPAFLQDILKEVGPEFAVALGEALRRLDEVQV